MSLGRDPSSTPQGFLWRGEGLAAVKAASHWVISRGGAGLIGPSFVEGEPWQSTVERLREWLDVHATRRR